VTKVSRNILESSAVKGWTDWRAGQYEMEGGSPRWDTKCTFDFYSSPTSKSGRFFSPRYPQLYPPSSVCLYVFFGLRGERVQVTFHNIQLDVPQYSRCAGRFTGRPRHR